MDENEADELLRALSHKERRRLIAQCIEKTQSAGDLAEQSEFAIASVSEHLKVLRKTGLVKLDKRGRHWFYQTNQPRLKEIMQYLNNLFE